MKLREYFLLRKNNSSPWNYPFKKKGSYEKKWEQDIELLNNNAHLKW